MSWVPSGEPSSTMMSSQSRLLEGGGGDVSCHSFAIRAPLKLDFQES